MPKQVKSELETIGWKKAAELVKVIRRDPEHFESAPWVHKAKSMPKEKFKDEVEKFLTGSAEPSDLLYFKVYKSQLPVIEEALEIAARMLGSDKSRGYCLEMICADFLAGATSEVAGPDRLLQSVERLCKFLVHLNETSSAHTSILHDDEQVRLPEKALAGGIQTATTGGPAARQLALSVLRNVANLEVHHLVLRSHSRRDCEDNLITLCHPCHQAFHRRERL